MKHLALSWILTSCLLASCSTRAADTCLVGTWKAQGNGAATWMARHMHGMRFDMGMREGELHLLADGRYESRVRLDAKASMDSGESAATHGPISVRSRGRWRAQEDQLTLQPQSQRARGAIDYVTHSGHRLTRPMPVPASDAMHMRYTCRGDTLVTRKYFPGLADPMIQRYLRVH